LQTVISPESTQPLLLLLYNTPWNSRSFSFAWFLCSKRNKRYKIIKPLLDIAKSEEVSFGGFILFLTFRVRQPPFKDFSSQFSFIFENTLPTLFPFAFLPLLLPQGKLSGTWL
jgi:hypothetical protein